MGEEITEKNLLKKLENLKDNDGNSFIKEGWLNGISNTITNDVIECIKNCTSPTGEGDEKLKAIFRAFSLFPMNDTKVLIIGQDPYPDDDIDRVNYYGRRAHGLAFSFANTEGIIEPPDDSLLNIFKAIAEYRKKQRTPQDNDIYAWHTNLKKWAKKGVLLLNTSLTFKKSELHSDKEKYALTKEEKEDIKKDQEQIQQEHINVWQPFVHMIIKKVIKENKNKLAVFLWGIPAQNTFFQSINEILSERSNNFQLNEKDIDKNELYQNKSKFKVVNKLVNSAKELELVKNKIKVYRTNHPSPISENNNGKFIEYSSAVSKNREGKGHFQSCDEFLFGKKEEDKEKYIWLNFPENNQ